MDALFSLIAFGPPVLAVLAGCWLAIDRRRGRAVRLLGAGISMVGLAELGLLMKWLSNLCWDEGGSCGQPLDTLFDIMGVTWFALAAVLLVLGAAWMIQATRSRLRHRH